MTGDRDAKRIQASTGNHLLAQVKYGDRKSGKCGFLKQLLLFDRCHLEDALPTSKDTTAVTKTKLVPAGHTPELSFRA